MENKYYELAKAGGGMNFRAKEVMVRSVLEGKEVIIIDPEKEYRLIAEQLGGTIKGEKIIFNGGKSSSTFINPLELNESKDLK